MVLFEEDIVRQKAYIDTNTKNLSFLKTAMVLKRMGVQNNKFPLTIYDRDLIGHDPHNLNDPSLDLRLAIAREAYINPWYYFREVIRIPSQGSDPVMFQLNRANLALIWIFYNKFDITLVIPRQTGKTISTQAIFSHIIYIYGRNLSVAMLTKDNTLRQENVIRLKDIRDGLPDYLVNVQTKDSDNKEGISYVQNKTRYLTFVAQKDASGADNLGRGMTVPVQHWDEAGMFANIQISYPVAISATNKAVQSARENNQPCTNIITTTAGKLDTEEGRFTYSLISDSLNFSEKLYDAKNINELTELISHGSTSQMVYAVYSYLQLGYTHEWFKLVTSRSKGTQDDIDRDYLNIWKMGTSSGVIDSGLLMKAKASEKDPLFTELTDNYVVNWYVDRHLVENGNYKKHPIVLGMDSSENIGRDFTTLFAIDAKSMRPIFTVRCNESNIIKVALFIVKMLLRLEGMVFIPERNSTGCTIIDMVILELEKRGINPFTRIYNTVVQNRDEDKFSRMDITSRSQADGIIRKYFGFKTTSSEKSRTYLYKTVLMKALELNVDHLYDKILIQELSGLTVRNNRIDHKSSGHDDMVIAYLLACYLLFAGKNLKFYGLEVSLVLSQFNNSTSKKDQEVALQRSLKNKIMELEETINSTHNEIVRASLIRRLNYFKSQIDEELDVTDESALSVDKYTNTKNEANEHKNAIIYNSNVVNGILNTF
jgi:hypothetical protein